MVGQAGGHPAGLRKAPQAPETRCLRAGRPAKPRGGETGRSPQSALPFRRGFVPRSLLGAWPGRALQEGAISPHGQDGDGRPVPSGFTTSPSLAPNSQTFFTLLMCFCSFFFFFFFPSNGKESFVSKKGVGKLLCNKSSVRGGGGEGPLN